MAMRWMGSEVRAAGVSQCKVDKTAHHQRCHLARFVGRPIVAPLTDLLLQGGLQQTDQPLQGGLQQIGLLLQGGIQPIEEATPEALL